MSLAIDRTVTATSLYGATLADKGEHRDDPDYGPVLVVRANAEGKSRLVQALLICHRPAKGRTGIKLTLAAYGRDSRAFEEILLEERSRIVDDGDGRDDLLFAEQLHRGCWLAAQAAAGEDVSAEDATPEGVLRDAKEFLRGVATRFGGEDHT